VVSGGLDTLVSTLIDCWFTVIGLRRFSMCFRVLKRKCFAIKLKCFVGDPDRFWNIGRKRCCTLYLTRSFCWLYYWSKDGWVVVGFECMAVVRRIFV
jgi:hypothetical protein